MSGEEGDSESITYSTARPALRKIVTPVNGVFLLYDVLTPEECREFVDRTEAMGYEEATIDTFDGIVKKPDLRNNDRVILQATEDVWRPIWERIERHIPNAVNVEGTFWMPYGLNDRFRFYRYDQEEKFGRHYDACFSRSEWDRSMLTFIVYLTDDFEGGGTMFYPKNFEVRPVKGMACVFFHGEHSLSPEHEGMMVTKGRKYVLRSDIMYKAVKG